MDKITISAQAKADFDLVMAVKGMTNEEIEECKESYRRDPEVSQKFYAGLAEIMRWKKPILDGNWVSARDMVINQPGKVKRA